MIHGVELKRKVIQNSGESKETARAFYQLFINAGWVSGGLQPEDLVKWKGYK